VGLGAIWHGCPLTWKGSAWCTYEVPVCMVNRRNRPTSMHSSNKVQLQLQSDPMKSSYLHDSSTNHVSMCGNRESGPAPLTQPNGHHKNQNINRSLQFGDTSAFQTLVHERRKLPVCVHVQHLGMQCGVSRDTSNPP
jgi:hypothetical protein